MKNRAFGAVGLVTAALALVISVLGGPSALAEPAEASCNFTLSKPFLVDVSGRTMVSATFSSLPCTGMLPNRQTACIQMEGSGAAPQCAYSAGYTPAQVYFAPYRPGTSYVSTGTGCGALSKTQVSSCSTRGPFTATL